MPFPSKYLTFMKRVLDDPNGVSWYEDTIHLLVNTGLKTVSSELPILPKPAFSTVFATALDYSSNKELYSILCYIGNFLEAPIDPKQWSMDHLSFKDKIPACIACYNEVRIFDFNRSLSTQDSAMSFITTVNNLLHFKWEYTKNHVLKAYAYDTGEYVWGLSRPLWHAVTNHPFCKDTAYHAMMAFDPLLHEGKL